MKKTLLILLIITSFISCKKEDRQSTVEVKPLTIAQKIANAHGIKNWDRVTQINFTFNVDRDSSHFERSWTWKPKTNDVTLTKKNETISYNRTKMDSAAIKADKSFINDKFWLLIPFQMAWDTGTTITNPVKSKAPISNQEMNMVTLIYSNEGGYTPGDAYDIFYDDNFIIKEWVYRKANAKEPSLTNTFENYQDYKGIKIAKDHKKADENWNLNFTNIEVILED